MSRLLPFLFLLTVFCAPSISRAISRWGNGRLSSSDGVYSTQTPNLAVRITSLGNGRIAMVLPAAIRTQSGIGIDLMEVSEFAEDLPGLARLPLPELRNLLITQGWIELPAVNCLRVFQRSTGENVRTLIIWARGQGMVVDSSDSNFAATALQFMLKHSELEPGVCSWK